MLNIIISISVNFVHVYEEFIFISEAKINISKNFPANFFRKQSKTNSIFYLQILSEEGFHGEPEGKVELKLGILGTTADVVDVAVRHKHDLIEHGVGYGEDGRDEPHHDDDEAETTRSARPAAASQFADGCGAGRGVVGPVRTGQCDVSVDGDHAHRQCGHVHTAYLEMRFGLSSSL